MATPDKLCTEEDVVAQLADGMTIGIGGWASRRKPMSIVRAILRSPAPRPHGRVLRRARRRPAVRRRQGAQGRRRVRLRLEPSPSSPTTAWPARRARSRRRSGTRACCCSACRQRRGGCRSCRAVRASCDILELMSNRFATVRSPYPGPGGSQPEELVAVPALELDATLLHMNRRRLPAATASSSGPTSTWTTCSPPPPRPPSCRPSGSSPPRTCSTRARSTRCASAASRWTASSRHPNGAHFTECPPDHRRDEAFQKLYAGSAASPEAWEEFRSAWLDVASEAEYQERVATFGEENR